LRKNTQFGINFIIAAFLALVFAQAAFASHHHSCHANKRLTHSRPKHAYKHSVRSEGAHRHATGHHHAAVRDSRKPLPVTDTYSMRGSVVRMALACRGMRYRGGGTGNGGFDCSGLVKYVYAKHGIKLPHSSRAMFSCGRPVPKSELRPGDLLFFSYSRRGISHVGIYVGNGRFVHASTYGRGVREDVLDQPGYHRRLVGARRLEPSDTSE